MAVDVIMPQMGESVAEGTIVRWLKAVGDSVDRDEPIFEITTDKVDAEIPAPEAGVLLEIKVGEGETVEVGSVVAIIGSADEKPSGGGAKKPAADAPKKEEPAAPAAAAPAADAGDRDRADMSAADLRRTRSTPVVRKIAEEHGIDDLSAIDGSGLDGRVTKKDILAYIESGAHEAAPAKPEAPKAAAPAKAAAPSASRVELGIPKIPVNVRPADTVEKMTGIRKATSDNMILSKHYSAHVHTCFEIDYTRIDRLRRKFKGQYAERGGKLTFTTFLAKATIDALKAFPIVNAAHDGDNVVFRGNINLGIAVALDRGLLVPVIGDADDLSMLGLSKRIADLSERARAKKLMPQELDGLTFSITNPGVFGSQWGTPVIPQPTTAILGVGTIEKRVKVHTLPDGTDTMVIRTCGYVTLGFDHRTIDGAVADAFVGHLKQTLEGFDESAMNRPLHVRRLGRVPYGEAWALQRALVAERAAGDIPDTLLLLEHDPVVTLGRDGNRGSLLLDEAGFAARGVELVESDRGGDATFHGPGQLVAYPILDLKPDMQDVGKFVRGLEQAMIDTVADYGLTAGRDPGNPGVWLDDPPRKVGAIGARISRWITHHGVALNVNVDLAYFGLIVPCGIVGKGVTSLQRELGRAVPLDEVADRLAAHLAARFGRALVADVPPIDHNGRRS